MANRSKETVLVPELEEMRAMTDAELLALRTDLSYDMAQIENQIRFPDQRFKDAPDEEWLRRAGAAQQIRQHGVGTIKNILAERAAAHRKDERIPLSRWMEATHDVVTAAIRLLDDDNDENWAGLERAVERYHNYTVAIDLIRETL